MKKTKLSLKAGFFLIAIIFSTTSTFAQFDNVGQILKGGKNDANKLLTEYITPLGKAWGYDLGGGWYNTAATHKSLGFDLTFSTNFAQTPDEDMLFNIAELGLEKIESGTGRDEFPTITNGEDVNSITIQEEIEYSQGGQTFTQTVTLLEDTEIKGFDIPVGIPMPTLNLGIGIVKNTELVGRYVPNTSIGDFGELGLWGIGLKHDFLQWLPIVDKVPALKGSIFLGYTKMQGNFGIDYQPDVDHTNNYTNPDNQELTMNTSSFHSAILIGAKLPVIHPYVSLGLTSGNFTLDVLGEYALPAPVTDENGIPTGETEIRQGDSDYTLTDPFNIEIENGLQPSFAGGLRIKLTVLTLHAQYTFQEYPMVTGGIGISFR
jgi:hypothetical protein